MSKVAVVVPNWNGADSLKACLDSLINQTLKADIIVVDNGSVDRSLKIVNSYKDIQVIKNKKNLGYTGGVNPGFHFAIDNDYDYVGTINNDAVADKGWLSALVNTLANNKDVGTVTSKILEADGKSLDSTGDDYTVWGLPYPRGRDETDINKYDSEKTVFSASGGASLYRVNMLKQIGVFDQSLFAYYEDIDLSFRAQLMKWQVLFEPKAIVHHQVGATSSKIKGFTTYQTMKNLPIVLVKDVPTKFFWKVARRLTLAYALFFLRACSRWQLWPAFRGFLMTIVLLPTSLFKRRKIQAIRIVPDEYIWSMMVHNLPTNAQALRRLRAWWRRVKN